MASTKLDQGRWHSKFSSQWSFPSQLDITYTIIASLKQILLHPFTTDASHKGTVFPALIVMYQVKIKTNTPKTTDCSQWITVFPALKTVANGLHADAEITW